MATLSEGETKNTEDEGEEGPKDGRNVDGEVDRDLVEHISRCGPHWAEAEVCCEKVGGRRESGGWVRTLRSKQLVRETGSQAV